MTYTQHGRKPDSDPPAPLDDLEFLGQFEALTLDERFFDHRGHLRLAWIYLTHHDTETAIKQICGGIKRYAESLGATDKFHLTLTHTLANIIAKRIAKAPELDWAQFLQANPDLLANTRGLLLSHFSCELLDSEQARTTLLEPDLKPI